MDSTPTPEPNATPGQQPEMPRKRSKAAPIGCGILLAVLIGLYVWIGPVVTDFLRAGVIQGAIGGVDKRKYEGDTIDNLRAMHTAMMAYHESEGMFPDASAWMDWIEPRLQTYDMDKKESRKKLVAPEFVGQEGKYGYAMNAEAALKYKDDLPEPSKTPLIFDSSKTERNAHGKPEELLPNPARPGGNKGISVDGTLLRF